MYSLYSRTADNVFTLIDSGTHNHVGRVCDTLSLAKNNGDVKWKEVKFSIYRGHQLISAQF